MSTTLHISAPHGGIETLRLVADAVEHEISRLELSLRAAQHRLEPFEIRYGVSSEIFYATMAAEDLSGGDEEYIRWAGEYEFRERLRIRIEQLQGLRYEY
jgi:hypothetical protein